MDAKRREELRQWIGAGRSEGTSHRYLNDLELRQLLDDAERVEQALKVVDDVMHDRRCVSGRDEGCTCDQVALSELRGSHD